MPDPKTAIDFLNRTRLLLGEKAIEALRGKTVTIAGCGGMGGASALLLARMGVGGFVLADPGIFDPPDINRQWGATRSNLGRNKAQVYEAMLKDINPDVRVTTYTEGVTEETLEPIVGAGDLVIDCLDLSVPLPLRLRVYQESQRRGVYCVSSPIFGIATLMMFAEPGGMVFDDVICDIIERARATSKLPEGFRTHLFSEHVDAIERQIHKGIVPSIAVSPAFAASFACSEILLILLREHFPHWRKPICLPEMLVIEALRPNYRVVHYREVFPGVPPRKSGGAPFRRDHSAKPNPDERRQRRREALSKAGLNVVSLPAETVELDLLTDSWMNANLPDSRSESAAATLPQVSAHLKALFPGEHLIPVFRGRFAEALLAQALVRPGTRVLSNALFPTTRLHLGRRGAQVVALPADSRSPCGGDVDPTVLERELEKGGVSAVYLELADNALGGRPVGLAGLQRVRELASKRGVPVVLDACRAMTNALQLIQLDPACRKRAPAELVRELLGLADAYTSSLTKEFLCPVGGLIAVNDGALAKEVRALAEVLFGNGLGRADLGRLLRSVVSWEESARLVGERNALTRQLTEGLTALGVPLASRGDCHAVFVDAAAFLPHLTKEQRPADALATELFALTGVRAAHNPLAPEQESAGLAQLRLAMRVGSHAQPELESVLEGFRLLRERPESVRGLRAVGGMPGMVGDLAERFELL